TRTGDRRSPRGAALRHGRGAKRRRGLRLALHRVFAYWPTKSHGAILNDPRAQGAAWAAHSLAFQGTNTVEPVVRRPSRSRCACAASASAYRCPILTRTTRLFTTAKSSR